MAKKRKSAENFDFEKYGYVSADQLASVNVGGVCVKVCQYGLLQPALGPRLPAKTYGTAVEAKAVEECKAWLSKWASKAEDFNLRNHPFHLAGEIKSARYYDNTRPDITPLERGGRLEGAVILAAAALGFDMRLVNSGRKGMLDIRFKMSISKWNEAISNFRAKNAQLEQVVFRKILTEIK